MSGPRAAPAWVEDAVLVYGPRKAGTTLFQNLLDGGEEMLVYPAELKLKYFVKHSPGPDALDAYRRESRIPTVLSPHLSQDRYALLWSRAGPGTLGDLVRRDAAFVLESCARPPSRPRLWAAKEVGGDTDAIVRLWRELFPRGRLLFILRDPLMVTRAVLNQRRRSGRRLGVLAIAREVLDPRRVVAAQSRHLGDPDVFAIAYEDLVADPDAVMRRVADALGIAHGDFLSRPSIFGEPTVVATSSREETSVFRDDVPWHEGLDARERFIVRITTMALDLLGRRLDYAALCRRLGDRRTD